jgi:TIR domain-containing protein
VPITSAELTDLIASHDFNQRIYVDSCGTLTAGFYSRKPQAPGITILPHELAPRDRTAGAGTSKESVSQRQGYPMNFEQSLFISYAHIDDQPPMPGEQGWITRFHTTLAAFLSTRLGREAKIWRDKKLQGNDVFANEIIDRFKQSAVLVSIVTRRYLKSEWCTREVREFCQSAQQTGGLAVGNKLRVFKVITAPVDIREEESLPAPMRDVLGYEFYTVKDGVPLAFDPAYGQEYKELLFQKVARLAWDVAQLLEILEARRSTSDSKGNNVVGELPSKPAVYLAECSYDRKKERGLLEGELKRLGYPVFPDKQLPTDEAEYIAAVESLLARCSLSIHLVGEGYGTVPNGPTLKSVGMHQNELAAARYKSDGLKRLIWLPQGTRSDQAPQQAFIEALHRDADAQLGADLIAGSIEELRAAIHATLRKIEQPEQKGDVNGTEAAAGENSKLIYLICDEQDRKATVPVRKLCKQLGFEVELPAFKGDASEVRKANQQLLRNCDAVLLFYGAGDEAWKRTVDNDLKKMAGYRDGRPLLAKCIYLAEPRTSDKEDLIDMEEPGLINGLDGFAKSVLTQSLKAVTAARE